MSCKLVLEHIIAKKSNLLLLNIKNVKVMQFLVHKDQTLLDKTKVIFYNIENNSSRTWLLLMDQLFRQTNLEICSK